MFLEGESLAAVFRYRAGPSIDQVFYRGDQHLWRDRLAYAQELLHQVLNMADLPAQVSLRRPAFGERAGGREKP